MFEKLNRRSTVMDGVDTQEMEFKPLKDFCGTKIEVRGFFFTEGRYGTQVVVVGNGYLINMPKRSVEQFEDIAHADKMLDEVCPDGVIVGTRCSLHVEMALKVIKRKIPLFLEKK